MQPTFIPSWCYQSGINVPIFFGEIRAQVHEITDREVIETFANGIAARWQFKDFNYENTKNNEDFKKAVEKLISSEEKTRRRFPDREN